MGQFKRILVGLDISDTDVSTIHYAALLSHLGPAEHISFLHASRDLDVAEAAEIRYPTLPPPLSSFIHAHMEETITAHFLGHEFTETVCEVVEGDPLSTFLHRVREQDIDLILVGKRQHSVLPGRLARKATCPVLIVPENAPPKITRLLVPVNFSEHATTAMEMGLIIARAYGVTEIICQHVAQIPHKYHAAGLSDEELADIMRHHAQHEYDKFMQGFNLEGVSVTFMITVDDTITSALQETVTIKGPDLIIIGARGRSTAAVLLLGSVTERLTCTTHTPLLVIKRGGRVQ